MSDNNINITVCTPTTPQVCVTYTPPAIISTSTCVSVGSVAQVCVTSPSSPPQPKITVTSKIVGTGFINE